ncbi:DUF1045 domain-containing protein [Acetobacteraceae bacterium H6797]|nr:DUF1045 domain-containing protein [Acetobacteraceae bacterium H6797]
MSARLALYFAPELDDPLHALASQWLGRDAETGASLPQPAIEGVDMAEITADARGYGFHGTLKPPFRLSMPYAEARALAADLAARTQPFALPPLAVTDLKGFLALCEIGPCPALYAFADACVEALDPARAPATPEEIARRRPERLSEREREYLMRWGYPHVFEKFQFHLTLTKRLPDEVKAIIRPAAEAHFAGVAEMPRMVKSLALFTQPGPGKPFTIAERLPLGGTA